MTTVSETVERRTRTQDMVDKWMAERQQMLVLFCRLAGLEPYTPDKPVKEQLKDFCEVLVDYTAFGHFEVYDRISRGEERRSDVLQVAEEVYPKVAEVADVVIAFNDKYDSSDHNQPLDQLHQDLSTLGENLALRIEMEDRIVSSLIA
ncbi:MAG: Rsd/AlgQ family anti-sigma factor [Sedimenticola sp.]|jgi:regulator of sigma D|nr:MAG: Rsd/AlgQ family anti-sigma factor [Sedimenticola sp.]